MTTNDLVAVTKSFNVIELMNDFFMTKIRLLFKRIIHFRNIITKIFVLMSIEFMDEIIDLVKSNYFFSEIQIFHLP